MTFGCMTKLCQDNENMTWLLLQFDMPFNVFDTKSFKVENGTSEFINGVVYLYRGKLICRITYKLGFLNYLSFNYRNYIKRFQLITHLKIEKKAKISFKLKFKLRHQIINQRK